MTRNYDASGVHAIRMVIWELLKRDLNWNTSRYGGLVPITTPQQAPEFNEKPYPYLVYNYSHQPSGQDFWLNEEQATFVVWSGTADTGDDDIRRVLNLIRDNMKAFDLSASMVNNWIAKSPNSNAEYKKFDYKWIRVVSSVGAGPAQQEGGRQNGVITIRYQYTYTEPTTGGYEGRADFNRSFA